MQCDHFLVYLLICCCSYELEGVDDLLGSGLGCVVRSAPESSAALQREDLECRAVNWQQCRYTLAEHEDQVSCMLSLKPANSTRLVFDVRAICCVNTRLQSHPIRQMTRRLYHRSGPP